MYCSKQIYLMLLPLAILLCFTCPIKQEIKQSLNIPINTQINIEKKNDLKSCITTITPSDLSQKFKKKAEGKVLLFFTENKFKELRDTTSKTSQNFNRQKDPDSVSLFILHRRLII